MAAMILSGILLLSACNLGDKGPEKSPEEVVKEAMSKAYEVKSGDYSITFDAELTDKSGSEAAAFKKLNFGGEISGVYDVRDMAAPKMSMLMAMKGRLDDSEKEEMLKGELRFLDGKAYVVLQDITDFDGNLPMVFVEPFKNQWYSIPVPADVIETALAGYKDEASMTEDEKKLKAIYEDMMLFKDLKYEGSEEVYGADTYKYSGKLDKVALKKYLEEYSKVSGEELAPADTAEMDKFFEKMEVDGELWISQDDTMIRKMSMKMTMKDMEGVDMVFEMGYGLPTLGGDVELEAPADAQEFDPAALFGGMMGPSTSTLELPEVETGEPIDVELP